MIGSPAHRIDPDEGPKLETELQNLKSTEIKSLTVQGLTPEAMRMTSAVLFYLGPPMYGAPTPFALDVLSVQSSLSDEDMEPLGKFLKTQQQLQTLDLSNNPKVSEDQLMRILENFINKQNTLKTLKLDGTELSKINKEKLENMRKSAYQQRFRKLK